jgi:uncharacterized protein (TIGR01244 family)
MVCHLHGIVTEDVYMKYSILLIVALISFSFVYAQQLDPLPNLQQPRFSVFTSGQPTVEGFRLIADTGIQTVINVLPSADCLTNEAGIVSGNKMDYYHFPFETSGFQKDTFEEFAILMAKVKKPVLIHCSTGNHVGGLWFGYRVLVDRAPIATALKEARRIGMKPALEDEMFNWLASQQQRADAR